MTELKAALLHKTLFGLGSLLSTDRNSVTKFLFSFTIYTQNIQFYGSILFAFYLFCDTKFQTNNSVLTSTTTTTFW